MSTTPRFGILRKSVADTKRLAAVLAAAAFGLGAGSVLAVADGTVGGIALVLVTLTGIAFLGMLAVLVTAAVTGFLLDLAIVQNEHR